MDDTYTQNVRNGGSPARQTTNQPTTDDDDADNMCRTQRVDMRAHRKHSLFYGRRSERVIHFYYNWPAGGVRPSARAPWFLWPTETRKFLCKRVGGGGFIKLSFGTISAHCRLAGRHFVNVCEVFFCLFVAIVIGE